MTDMHWYDLGKKCPHCLQLGEIPKGNIRDDMGRLESDVLYREPVLGLQCGSSPGYPLLAESHNCCSMAFISNT